MTIKDLLSFKIGRAPLRFIDYYRPDGYPGEIIVHESGFIKLTMDRPGRRVVMRGDVRVDGTIVVIEKQDYFHIDFLGVKGSYHEVRDGKSETYDIAIEVLK